MAYFQTSHLYRRPYRPGMRAYLGGAGSTLNLGGYCYMRRRMKRSTGGFGADQYRLRRDMMQVYRDYMQARTHLL